MTNIPGLDGHWIREAEEASIRSFVTECMPLLRGAVLDFGCGTSETCRRPMPYKDLIERAGGTYYGYDPALGHSVDAWLKGPYDAILCTQVLQYIKEPMLTLTRLKWATKPGGHLVLSFPTTWTETVEENDYWRFTAAGMKMLLDRAGWKVLAMRGRGRIDVPEWPLWLGHGVAAKVGDE